MRNKNRSVSALSNRNVFGTLRSLRAFRDEELIEMDSVISHSRFCVEGALLVVSVDQQGEEHDNVLWFPDSV